MKNKKYRMFIEIFISRYRVSIVDNNIKKYYKTGGLEALDSYEDQLDIKGNKELDISKFISDVIKTRFNKYDISNIVFLYQNMDVMIRDIEVIKGSKESEIKNVLELELRQINNIDINKYILKSSKIDKLDDGMILLRCRLVPKSVLNVVKYIEKEIKMPISQIYTYNDIIENDYLSTNNQKSKIKGIFKIVKKSSDKDINKEKRIKDIINDDIKIEYEKSKVEYDKNNIEYDKNNIEYDINDEENDVNNEENGVNNEENDVKNIVVREKNKTSVYTFDNYGMKEFIVFSEENIDGSVGSFLKDSNTEIIDSIECDFILSTYINLMKRKLNKQLNKINLYRNTSRYNLTNKITRVSLAIVFLLSISSIYLHVNNSRLEDSYNKSVISSKVNSSPKIPKIKGYNNLYGICIDKINKMFYIEDMLIEEFETEGKKLTVSGVIIDNNKVGKVIDELKISNLKIKKIENVEKTNRELKDLKNIREVVSSRKFCNELLIELFPSANAEEATEEIIEENSEGEYISREVSVYKNKNKELYVNKGNDLKTNKNNNLKTNKDDNLKTNKDNNLKTNKDNDHKVDKSIEKMDDSNYKKVTIIKFETNI